MGKSIFLDQMTPKERINALHEGKPYDRIPCILMLSGHAGKIVGIDQWESYFSGQKTAQTQIEAYRIFGVEVVGSGPWLHGIAEALGSTVIYPKEENSPYISEHVLRDVADLNRLQIPNPRQAGKLPVHLEALEILSERLGKEVPVSTGIAGPFTTAANLRGTEAFLRDLYYSPELAHKILRIALDSTIAYVEEAGKLGVWFSIADPTASGSLISSKQFQEFAFPYLKELIEVIKRVSGNAPTLHICGNTKKIWQAMVDAGAGTLSLDDKMDLAEAKIEVGDRVILSGSVKPTQSMYLGTPEDVVKDAKECLRKAYDSPKGYLLGLGCGLPMGTPLENIQALFWVAKKYGRYPLNPEVFS